MLVVPRSPSIADDVRQRIVDRVFALQRSLTWLAHKIGKSKQWASDFKSGRGGLTIDELPAVADALEWSVDHILYGETYPDSPSTDTAPGLEAALSEQERMLIALWRQLGERAKVAALDFLWKLYRQQGGTLKR